jgi:hypothetical protein
VIICGLCGFPIHPAFNILVHYDCANTQAGNPARPGAGEFLGHGPAPQRDHHPDDLIEGELTLEDWREERVAAAAAVIAQPRPTPPNYRCFACERFHGVNPCFPGCGD